MKTRHLTIFAMTVALTTASFADQFEITWTNHGPQPLSPLFWSVGNSSFDIFQFGGSASEGIEAIAEGGNTAPMLALATAAGSSVQAFGVLGGAPLMPGNSLSAIIDVNSGSDYFSFATMLGQTNDGFLGESVSSMGLRLFNGNVATGFSVNIFGARAWDAGTEQNTQNAADLGFLGGSGSPADSQSFIRVHETIVPGLGDSFTLMPDWATGSQLATVTAVPVPEPATLVAIGLGTLALIRRNRKSR